MKLRVLFVCTTNSVQSVIAQALLESLDPAHFEAFSAGIIRGETHSLTVDFVITLSDPAKTECPEFPGAELIHWQFDDPSVISDPDKQLRLFRSLRDQIAQRVRLFVLVQTRFASAS